MGLDMYLERAKFVDGEWITSGSNELVYWRKANMIRQWIVDHTDYPQDCNCMYHELSREQIEALLSDCKKVYEAQDNKLSAEILPTSSGYFFGGTEYDEYYYEDIRYTIEKLEELLEDWDEITCNNWKVCYYEWW